MKKRITIIAASICFALLIFGSSCSKEFDDIIIREETTHEDHGTESHVETRASTTTYCTKCGYLFFSHPNSNNCSSCYGLGTGSYCGTCGSYLSAITGACPLGHGNSSSGDGPYHCKSCKSRNVVAPYGGNSGSCNNCGSDPNWKGLELCSGVPCSKCQGSGSGSSGWLVGLFNNDIINNTGFITELFEQWLSDIGAEVILTVATYEVCLAICEAIQSGSVSALEMAIIGGSEGAIGQAMIHWLSARGF